MVDEFRTSSRCSTCGDECKTCSKLWNRDTNEWMNAARVTYKDLNQWCQQRISVLPVKNYQRDWKMDLSELRKAALLSLKSRKSADKKEPSSSSSSSSSSRKEDGEISDSEEAPPINSDLASTVANHPELQTLRKVLEMGRSDQYSGE